MIDESLMKEENTKNAELESNEEPFLNLEYDPEFNNKNFQYEKNMITNKLKDLEKEFLAKYDEEFIQNKQQKIKEFLRDIQSKSFITEQDYRKLKEFAIEKAGFISNENRQSIYRKIFFHELDNKRINILKLNLEQSNFINLSDYKEIKKLRPEDLLVKENIIELDIRRSKLHFLFDDKQVQDYLHNRLSYYLNFLVNLNSNKYSYIQGYHDIILNFLLIFINKKDDFGLTIAQRFSEIYYSDLLTPKETKGASQKNDLNFIINLTNTIIKKINFEIFEILKDCCDANPTFALTWIITFFGYCYDNLIFQFRFLDYFLCSHPISVYYLTAVILVDEILKWKSDENERKGLEISELFQHFNNLEFTEIEFDEYIKKADGLLEESLKANFTDLFDECPELLEKRSLLCLRENIISIIYKEKSKSAYEKFKNFFGFTTLILYTHFFTNKKK